MKPLHERPQFIPLVWSLGLHGLLVGIAFFIHFSEPQASAEEMLHFNVKSVDTRPLLLKHTSPATNPDSKNPSRRFIRPAGENSPKDVPMDMLVKPETIKPKEAPEIEPKSVELSKDPEESRPQMGSMLTDTEERSSPDVVQVQRRATSGEAETQKMVQRHKTDVGQLVTSFTKSLQKLGLGAQGNVEIDPEEGMPGFTPLEGTFGNSTFDQGGGTGESRGEILKYESLDEFLDIRMFTYQDPKDSQKYFMIKIFTKNDAGALQVMPKEILFAIDCSLSISPERLDAFKQGISACLKNLNKDDLFNIVAFKDQAFKFRAQSVKATAETIKEAERFVSGLTSNKQTDVYNALSRIVKSTPARHPSNVILISDGRPTHGIVDSRELINSVTRLNDKTRPIFAYSGGAKVNRYLLDFIAYQNRAWSQFVKDRGKIRSGLADFYSKIKDPIFLNLRYQLNGLNEAEVFPRSLPDFYRNAEFTLYGQYTDEKDFSMQLLGDIGGETKELIFTRSLAEAQAGGPEVMKGYAFNKIYYLISRVTTEGQNPAHLKQIQDLGKRYGVTTPYSPDLQQTD